MAQEIDQSDVKQDGDFVQQRRRENEELHQAEQSENLLGNPKQTTKYAAHTRLQHPKLTRFLLKKADLLKEE